MDTRRNLRPVMLGGTGSDVGKSILAAGLCRIFLQDGYSPAPFKAQNMALNSYVTADGLELGRAQAVQAEAAGIECLADMNPILLKPIGNSTSQVVLNGRPEGNRTARDYFNKEGRKKYADVAHAAFDRLAARYNPIVMEGAGGISEINLAELDIVNMPMAEYAGAAVILVADIRRGGVFASVYGSIALQPEHFRKMIKGIIINQFRGDASLFEQGRKMMEEICGVPVLGVMPYIEDLYIEEEDAYFRRGSVSNASDRKVKIAVVRLRHISNFTDFDPLECDSRVNVVYTVNPAEIRASDIIIIPGSKATIADLEEIKNNGVAEAIVDARKMGKTVIGICGGFQMMGERIDDPLGVEGVCKQCVGLGLLPTTTVITEAKLTRRIDFTYCKTGENSTGYEIHMGTTSVGACCEPVALLADGKVEGCRVDDRCFGTYLHGLFENRCVVNDILEHLSAEGASDTFDYKAFKESQYDRLAAEMRKHIDIDRLYKIMQGND